MSSPSAKLRRRWRILATIASATSLLIGNAESESSRGASDSSFLRAIAVDEPLGDDAIGREISVRNQAPAATPQDALSREFSVRNDAGASPATDAISREFSVNNQTPVPQSSDAVSREFSVRNQAPPEIAVDAISREFSVRNDIVPPSAIDAISREFSVRNEATLPPTVSDAISREFSVRNDIIPSLPVDAISREFSVRVTAPDLIVESITSPTGPQTTRQPFSVTWRDKNVGDAAARGRKGAWLDRVYISRDAVLDRGSDFLCQPPTFNGSLAPGAGVNRTASCEWPVEPGCYYLIVETDALQDVNEGQNESNNVTIAPRFRSPGDEAPVCVTVSVDERPNLQIVAGSIVPPPRIIPGQSATFSWKTVNVGTATAIGPWSESIYLSRDGTMGNLVTVRDLAFPDSLPAGPPPLDRSRTFTVPTNINLNPGFYKVVICADSTGPPPYRVVVELDESDNCAMSGQTVCFNCLPDLVVEPLDAVPLVVNDGQTVFVPFTVRNQGTGDAVGAWLDKVYLSKDAVIGNDDFRSQLSHTGPLAAGDFYNASPSVSIPPGLHGEYWFVVCTDTQNNVSEFGGENNNCRLADQPTLINQGQRPDLRVLTIGGDNDIPGSSDPLYVGTRYTLFWQVKNFGSGTANDVWQDRVYLSQDDHLDVGVDQLLGSPMFSGILPPEGVYSQSIVTDLPMSPGTYRFFVCTDAGAVVPEDTDANNCSSFQISVVAPEYGATAQVNVARVLVNTPVTITGAVYDLANPSVLLPNKPIEIRVWVKNQRRVFSAKSGVDGTYEFKLTMAPSDAGECKIFAEHPAVSENRNTPDDTFVFYGVQAPSGLNLSRTGPGIIHGSIGLTNTGDTIVPGVTAVVAENSPYFDIELTSIPNSLAPGPGSSASLAFNVHVQEIPPPNTAMTATIRTYIAGFAEPVTTTSVHLYVSPEQARLTVTPGSLSTTVARGSQAVVSFEVSNAGGAIANDVRVAIPCLANPGCNPGPNCTVNETNCPTGLVSTGLMLNLVTPASIDSIEPGKSRQVELAFQPNNAATLGNYSGQIAITSPGSGLNVPFNFRVISADRGTLRVRAEDELTYYGFVCNGCSAAGCPDCPGCPLCNDVAELNGQGPLVANASVRVYDALTGELKCLKRQGDSGCSTTISTGAAGQVTLVDIPEGFYKVDVRADKHGSYQTTVEVKATDTAAVAAAADENVQTVTAFLPSNAVTYVWTVEPTEVEDEYKVTITATFETHVPLPVVTIDPTVIELDLQPGQSKIVDLTIRNHGFIAAQGAVLELAAPTGYRIDALFTDLGTIPPGNIPIVVPVTIRRESAAVASALAGSGGGPCSEAIPFGVRWFYICNVPVWKFSQCYFRKLRDCPAPNPGGSPCCSGDGSSAAPPYVNPPSYETNPLECDPPPDPGDDGPPCRGCGCVNGGSGDGQTQPVNLFSGEWTKEVEDLRIPGRGMDFAWKRHYRSKAGRNTDQGNGWDFFYNMSIARGGCRPNDGGTSQDIAFRDGMGRCDVFKPGPSGTWTRSEYFEEFSQNPDGTISFIQSDQGRHNFHALTGPLAGKLISIVDRNGNTLRFDYDASGRLNRITDTLDREIIVTYNADGKIATVTDFAGRQVKYEYYRGGEDINGDGIADGSAGDLKSVTGPAVTGTPNGNDFPAGKTVTYTYSTGFANGRLNHNLLSVTDAKGQTYLRNVYSSTLDPADRNFDRVVRQVWGDAGDIVDIVYVPLVASAQNGNAVMRTIVNDRVGNVTEYFFDLKNRLIRQREYTGRANPDQPTTATSNRPAHKLRASDPDYFETHYEWDNDSLLTRKVDPNGTVTEYVYESGMDPNAPQRTRANLRETRHLQGGHAVAGDQPQLASLSEYDSGMGSCCGFNFATKETDARGNVTEHKYDDRGNRTRTIYPIAGMEESFEYNAFGQMTAHILPDNGSGHRRRDEYVYYDSGPMRGYLHQHIVDATGFALTTTYEYDAVGNVTRMIDPRGNDTQFVVNALNQVVREISREVDVLDNAGQPIGSVRYERDTFYDANDNVVRIDVQNIDDAGQVVAVNPVFTALYEYETLNNLRRKTEEVDVGHNIVTEYEYDAVRNRTLVRFGEAVAGRQPDNVAQTLYDERNLVYREVRGAGGPDASVTQYDYDGNRNRVAVRHGLDANEVTDHVTKTVYDAFNRPVHMDDAMGNVTLYQYDANGNRALVTIEGELDDVPGSASNLLLSQVRYTYDALNRLTKTDESFFDTRTQASIDDGVVTTKTFYSPNSQVVRTEDDRGNATLTSYDSANRRRTVTDAKGNTVTYDYDGNSNIVKITEVEKSDLGTADETFVTLNEYDALDRLVTTRDNLLNTNRSYYDSRNNRTRTVDALSHEVRYVYDGLSRLLKTVRDMDGDGADPASTTNGMAEPDIVTAQTWDDSSRLTGQTDDNGNTTTYVYDGLNRKVKEIYADRTEKRWEFDVHNNNVFWTDANGNHVTQFFDALDRRTDVDVVPGPTVSHDTTFEMYKYDGLGRLTWAQDDDSIVTRAYDSLSRVTTETQQYLDEPPAIVRAVYDGVGNNTLLYYPSGRVIETTYDSLNRKQVIKDQGDSGYIAEYFYKGPSRVERRDYGNNTRMDVEYDGAKRTTRTRHTVVGPMCNADADCPSGNTCEVATHTCVIDDRTYQWDKMYNKTQMADVRPGGPLETRDYTYDRVYRLIGSDWHNQQGPIDIFAYELDGVGNRIRVSGGEDAGDYIMDDRNGDLYMNRYSATPFDGRRYDGNGNLIEIRQDDDFGRFGDWDLADFSRFQTCLGSRPIDSTLCLPFDADGDGTIDLPDWHVLSQQTTAPASASRVVQHDARNRTVITLDLPSGGRFAYGYDALGRRLSKMIDFSESSSSERFLSYLYNEIEEFSELEERITHIYGNAIDEVLQSLGTVTSFVHTDELLSVSSVTTPNGLVTGAFSYSDYGVPTGSIDSVASHLFNGRRFDRETQNHFYRTRYLDPRVGQFASPDRIGTWGDATNLGNTFTFVRNNPSTLRDPFGLWCHKFPLSAGLGLGVYCKLQASIKACVDRCCHKDSTKKKVIVDGTLECAYGAGIAVGPFELAVKAVAVSSGVSGGVYAGCGEPLKGKICSKVQLTGGGVSAGAGVKVDVTLVSCEVEACLVFSGSFYPTVDFEKKCKGPDWGSSSGD